MTMSLTKIASTVARTVVPASIRFDANDSAEYSLAKPAIARHLQAGFWKMLANFITGFTTGCAEQPEPFESEEHGQIIAVDTTDDSLKGWTFCAKKNVVEDNSDDCFFKTYIQDKISSCVYLTGIIASSARHFEEIEYDHDKLMTFLISYDDDSYYRFCFDGNNEWPDGFFSNNCNNTVAYLDQGLWLGYDETFKIIPNKDTWSAQVWFRQPPDLCWAVYETPCADESVCE